MRRKRKKSNTKPPIHDRVTQKLLALLKEEKLPWRRPWKSASPIQSLLPLNGKTKRNYNGINILLLWGESRDDPRWYSYKQALESSGQVRRGEKGTEIVFFKKIEVEEKGDTKEIPIARGYSMFNHEQIDWGEDEPPPPPASQPHAEASAILDASGIPIDHGGDRAFYKRKEDFIRLPPYDRFESADAYFSTALHEAAHATSHESRLNRHHPTNNAEYAFEELIAEIASSFLCAHCGIESQHESAVSYIQHWIAIAEEDNRAFFKAASAARLAMQHLLRLDEQ